MLVSKHLEKMRASIHGKTTIGAVVEGLRHSGFGLLIIFLCLPFLQPIPMAGLSTALGLVIALLGFQMMMKRKSVWLPQRLSQTPISEKTGKTILDAAAKFFNFVETLVHPRLSFFARQEHFIGFAIFVSAVMLAMPIPIPFSNMLCAAPIVLMALAILETDGLMAFLGITGLAISIAFHFALFLLGWEGVQVLLEKFWPLF